jgi:hypothetical protein
MNFLLKLLKAKKRNEIRGGKLWEITSVWGYDIKTEEQEPAKPLPFVKPEASKVDAMRVHIITGENNKTNLTKDADFL